MPNHTPSDRVVIKTQIVASFYDGQHNVVLAEHKVEAVLSLHRGNKIDAIKYARAEWDLGLLEAKLLVEEIAARYPKY